MLVPFKILPHSATLGHHDGNNLESSCAPAKLNAMVCDRCLKCVGNLACAFGISQVSIVLFLKGLQIFKGTRQNSLTLTTNVLLNVTEPSKGISYSVGDL